MRISFSTASRASFLALGLASSPTRCSTWWIDRGLGQDDLNLVEEEVDEGVARGEGLLGLLGLGGLLLQVFLELVDGVELGDHLSEVVVSLGQLAGLHGLDGDGHLGLFALVLAPLQLGGEGDLFAGLGAAQGGVLAVEHGAGADLVGDVGGGVNLLTVDGGNQVDGREVAGLGLAVDGLEGGEAATQVLEFLLDVLFGDLGGLDSTTSFSSISGSSKAGTTSTSAAKTSWPPWAPVTLGISVTSTVGCAMGRRSFSLTASVVVAGQDLVDDLLDDGGAAEALVDDARRHVALTEAGDVDLSGDLLVRLVHFGLQFLEGNLNGQTNLGGLEGFNGALHVRTLRSLRIGERPLRAHNNSLSVRHGPGDVSLRRAKSGVWTRSRPDLVRNYTRVTSRAPG